MLRHGRFVRLWPAAFPPRLSPAMLSEDTSREVEGGHDDGVRKARGDEVFSFLAPSPVSRTCRFRSYFGLTGVAPSGARAMVILTGQRMLIARSLKY